MWSIVSSILNSTLVSGTPLLLGTLGEIYSERVGILNLGIEGIMSASAVVSYSVCYTTHNPWLGLLAGCIIGGLLALLHGFITITLKASQIVSGLALTIFGLGLSGLIGKSYIGCPLSVKFENIKIPILYKIPYIGEILFNKDPIFYFSIIIGIVLWYLLYYTKLGIEIRSIGLNPTASQSLGISINKIKYGSVILGGILFGMAGSYLSLVYITSWIEGMVAGRGWIIIALTVFTQWNPARAFIGAYIFGGTYILQYYLRPLGIPSNILLMLPYIATLVVLFFSSSKFKKFQEEILFE